MFHGPNCDVLGLPLVFNSLVFAIFFALVFPLAYALRARVRVRNVLLLTASYVFYGWWDWRFLSLIVLSTVVDYSIGLAFDERAAKAGARDERTAFGAGDADVVHVTRSRRHRLLLLASVTLNLGILAFFKYFGFFVESASVALAELGLQVNPWSLHIILPVGISFYTFQTMSYTIDLYRGTIATERSFLNFATFVAFFPQLVAGPIERAAHLLPQLSKPAEIDAAKLNLGAYWILVGLVKKVVIADNLARLVNPVFAASEVGGLDVMIAVYAFAMQIYGDFSGYTDIARGTSLMLGFDLRSNFDAPYLATNPSDFWRRWHISLSSWLRDYLYIPLGGNRQGPARTQINLMLTMLLGGLWHGAAWTYVLWGAYQGGMLAVHRALGPVLKPIGARARDGAKQTAWWLVRVVVFFQFTCLGWLIFRAERVSQIWDMLKAVLTSPATALLRQPKSDLGLLVASASLLFVVHVYAARRRDEFFILGWPRLARGLVYSCGVLAVIWLGEFGGDQFIYFQF